MGSVRYDEYLKSDHWKNLRLSVLKRARFKCERCASEGKVNNADHVHHINYKNLHDVETTDLLAVCGKCHKRIHRAIEKGYIPISGQATIDSTIFGYTNHLHKNKKKQDKTRNKYELTEKMCLRMTYLAENNQFILKKILKLKNYDFPAISGKKVKKSTYKRVLYFLGDPFFEIRPKKNTIKNS